MEAFFLKPLLQKRSLRGREACKPAAQIRLDIFFTLSLHIEMRFLAAVLLDSLSVKAISEIVASDARYLTGTASAALPRLLLCALPPDFIIGQRFHFFQIASQLLEVPSA